MKILANGDIIELPKIIPPTANPKDFRDHLLITDHLPNSERLALIRSINNYAHET